MRLAPVEMVGLLSSVLPLSFPHLLAQLVHAVGAGRVDQRQEVLVPQLGVEGLARGIRCVALPELVQVIGRDDVKGQTQEGLHEAVFHSMAVVHP